MDWKPQLQMRTADLFAGKTASWQPETDLLEIFCKARSARLAC